jgi:hypothetical protein
LLQLMDFELFDWGNSSFFFCDQGTHLLFYAFGLVIFVICNHRW